MALCGQRPRLDRVCEYDRRAVPRGVGLGERREQVVQVVAGEVADRGEHSASSSSATSFATARPPRPSPGSRSRNSEAGRRSKRWNSSLPIRSIRSRSASPRSRANSSRNQRPYLTEIVCQPAASNIDPIRPAAMSGTTRSNDWRFRSTIHSTSPSRGTIRSTRASQIAPSSSSASPSSAIWRPPWGTSKCPAT